MPLCFFLFFQRISTKFHHNQGAVECIQQIPSSSNHVLIAFNRGICVLWNIETNIFDYIYISPGHGQSVGIYIEPGSRKFSWYHTDGSYATWDMESTDPPEDDKYIPYGPGPCKPINRLVRGFRGDDEIVVFSGGMPRASYGDHNCVSIHCKDNTKITLDFTSKVIDFFITFDNEEIDQVEVLVVLLEEELLAYDLTNKKLPYVYVPYLYSIHTSAVTCNYIVSDVNETVFEKIIASGSNLMENFSSIGKLILRIVYLTKC